MNKLKIDFLDDKPAGGRQLIDLSLEEGGLSRVLFKGEVDYPEFIGWIIENEREIKFSDLPIENREKYSIAKLIKFFYKGLDVDDDDLVDKTFNYRASHCLRFASRGTDIPEIFIGKSDRLHEISLFNEHEQWQFFFDADEFFNLCKK